MRRTKYAGLNLRAQSLVGCAVKSESVGSLSAVWQNLKRYTLPDGRVYTEVLQAVVESISQVYFVSLRDVNGNDVAVSLWTEAEMKTW